MKWHSQSLIHVIGQFAGAPLVGGLDFRDAYETTRAGATLPRVPLPHSCLNICSNTWRTDERLTEILESARKRTRRCEAPDALCATAEKVLMHSTSVRANRWTRNAKGRREQIRSMLVGGRMSW